MFARRLLRFSDWAIGARHLVLALLASTWAGPGPTVARWKPEQEQHNRARTSWPSVKSTDAPADPASAERCLTTSRLASRTPHISLFDEPPGEKPGGKANRGWKPREGSRVVVKHALRWGRPSGGGKLLALRTEVCSVHGHRGTRAAGRRAVCGLQVPEPAKAGTPTAFRRRFAARAARPRPAAKRVAAEKSRCDAKGLTPPFSRHPSSTMPIIADTSWGWRMGKHTLYRDQFNSLDGRWDPPVFAPAFIIRDRPQIRLNDVETTWTPAREEVAQSLAQLGEGGEHGHWNWRSKIGSAEWGRHRVVAIECDTEIQGLMAIVTEPRPGAIGGSNSPILYVDYVESAPWNLRGQLIPPRFLGVGTVLIAEAVRLSMEAGLRGRIGLHSLPQAERFYSLFCQMTLIGQDPHYYNLPYFEYNEEQANNWLAAVGLT